MYPCNCCGKNLHLYLFGDLSKMTGESIRQMRRWEDKVVAERYVFYELVYTMVSLVMCPLGCSTQLELVIALVTKG